MTREEYLNQLKNNLLSLTEDEQAEALQYYSDYFEEANDDQKVISELGAPEELAKTIVEKFANALVNKNEKKESESKSGVNADGLYYEFDKKKVKSIALNFGAAEIVMISGKTYSVETRGISKDFLNCSLNSDGVLTVNNTRKINIDFWSHERKLRVVPRILLTVPETAAIDKLKIVVGAGDLRAKNVDLHFNSGNIEVGAGNLVLNNIQGANLTARCGMGNLEVKGSITGRSNIDCGMGCVKFDLNGNAEDYSYDAKVGLGDFRFNKEKKAGVCKSFESEIKENHFSVNCGMGSVSIFVK